MIVHVVEALARQGITDLHMVLNHFPEMIEKVLEEGSRWGVQIATTSQLTGEDLFAHSPQQPKDGTPPGLP